jgi:hypothetical protein
MPEHSLPDNLCNWPKDPYALLGVAHGLNHLDLRRAYTRLIRIYKPEQFPEQFRRIREAYESLQMYSYWQTNSNAPIEPDESGPTRHVAESTKSNDGLSSTPAESRSLAKNSTPPYDDFWGIAVAGDLQRAYTGLLEMSRGEACTEQIYLQLYWLLFTRAELDVSRVPYDWLLDGLKACTNYASILEVFRSEISECPRLAYLEELVELLTMVSDPLLVELLELRWRAATTLEYWDIPVLDMDRFGQRIRGYSEAAWLELLASLCSRLICKARPEPQSLWFKVQQDIEELKHLELSHAAVFDRVEWLTALADEWSSELAEGPVKLVELFVGGFYEETRSMADEALAFVGLRPMEGMAILDELRSEAPHWLDAYGKALDWIGWSSQRRRPEPLSSDDLLRHAYQFVILMEKYKSYARARREVLLFCCRKGVPPWDLSQRLAQVDVGATEFAHLLESDQTLCLSYRAYELCWT